MSNYPASVDTLETLLIASNNTRTRLVGAIGSGTLDILVQDASAFQSNDGIVSIGTEVIKYDTKSGNLLQNCTRGFDGTTAVPHQDGAEVDLRWVAAHHNGLADAVRKIEQTLGVNPQGSFQSVLERLSLNLPYVIAKSSSLDWSFTHSRLRLVGVQLWRKVGTEYEQFFADVSQQLNPSGSATVSITLSEAEEGFIIVH